MAEYPIVQKDEYLDMVLISTQFKCDMGYVSKIRNATFLGVGHWCHHHRFPNFGEVHLITAII